MKKNSIFKRNATGGIIKKKDYILIHQSYLMKLILHLNTDHLTHITSKRQDINYMGTVNEGNKMELDNSLKGNYRLPLHKQVMLFRKMSIVLKISSSHLVGCQWEANLEYKMKVGDFMCLLQNVIKFHYFSVS